VNYGQHLKRSIHTQQNTKISIKITICIFRHSNTISLLACQWSRHILWNFLCTCAGERY